MAPETPLLAVAKQGQKVVTNRMGHGTGHGLRRLTIKQMTLM
jgi:hypothetical protein